MQQAINAYLNKLARTEIYVLTKPWPAFRVFIYAGVVFGLALTLTLAFLTGLSTALTGLILLAAIAACFAQAITTKIVTGRESSVYYHQLVLVMITAITVVKLFDEPVLPYLGITVLGMAGVQMMGRIGCLMAGCCHGKPYHLGVCYGEAHARDGFTPHYVNVRLFPIQLVESLWALGIVLVGSILVLSRHAPGEIVVWYVISYGAGRFCFEFMRGDPERPYLLGFSEAQWTSLLLMVSLIWAEMQGIISLHLWHAGATAGLVLTMIAVALRRRFRRTGKHRLLHPRHIKEVAEAVEVVSNLATESAPIFKRSPVPTAIHIACTSQGIQISASRIQSAAGFTQHYTLSSKNEIMTEEAARTLARLILQLKHLSTSNELIKGNGGVFHLLIHPN